MKKSFLYYVYAWLLMLVLFNLAVFLVPEWRGIPKFTPSFFIGYCSAMLAFLGQLLCAAKALMQKSPEKTFYNISVLKVSYAGSVATFLVGVLFMIVVPLPYWVVAIACFIPFAFNAVSVGKAKTAVAIVTAVDKKIEKATAFIEEMRAESASLYHRAESDAVKEACRKVRDEFKFSDPMGSPELERIEFDIKDHFSALEESVFQDDGESASEEAKKLISLIRERGAKCKSLKK